MTSAPAPLPPVTADVEIAVGDYRLAAKLSVPAEPVPLRIMLPVVQSLADGFVDIAARAAEDAGKAVSCKKGCGACCRQLVPVSEVEARHIAALVERLPEPRRSQVRARFTEARQRLEQSGMLDKLRSRATWAEDEFRRVGLEYFRLGIACPFLEEESCSIHADRPVTCREYLVTSPAENCTRPSPEGIDLVPLPVKLWRELARFDETPAGAPYLRWVPLALAPAWAAEHLDEPPARPGLAWLEDLFCRLAARARNGGADMPAGGAP